MNAFIKNKLSQRYLEKRVQLQSRLPLSAVTSELHDLLRNNDFAHVEVDAYYAPSECHRDVDRGMAEQIEEIIKKHGFSDTAVFLRVLRQRTTDHWVYVSGIGRIDSF